MAVSSVFYGTPFHEKRIEKFWVDVCAKREVDLSEEFLISDIDQFLENAAQSLQPGDRKIFTFYSQSCGFDKLFLEEPSLPSILEFRQKAEEHGLKVNFCLPYRFLARFETAEELESFLKSTFDAPHIPLTKTHLRFPGKIIITEIEKP